MAEQPAGQLADELVSGGASISTEMVDLSDRLTPRDRWAIVAYVRALQRSQSAGLDDVPPSERERLRRSP